MKEKTLWKLFQIRATQRSRQVPIVWPMIAPFTPAPIERITMIAVMLNAGRAASMRANVIARPSNQITISASLKIAQTAPVMVANSTTRPLARVVKQERGDLRLEDRDRRDDRGREDRVHTMPTPSV